MRRVVLLLVLLVVLVEGLLPRLVRRPLARWMERSANARLAGFALHVGAADLTPLRLGVRLRDVSLQDDARRSPPVLRARAVDTGLRVHGLGFATRITLDAPVIEVDRRRLEALRRARLGDQLMAIGREAADSLAHWRTLLGDTRLERGRVRWMSPDGEVVLEDVAMSLANASGDDAGGSDDRFALRVEARLGEAAGRLEAHGAGALLDPHGRRLGLAFAAHDVPLAAFAGVARHARLQVRGGFASARGRVRVVPEAVAVRLREARLRDADVDWRHTAVTWAEERARLAAEGRRAQALAREWGAALRVDRVSVERSTLGLVDATRVPGYRLFLVADRGTLWRLGSGDEAPSRVSAVAHPFGTGVIRLDGTIERDGRRPNVGLRLTADGVALTGLNDMLRAYEAPPLTSGTFSLVLDAGVRRGQIAGYVKPFFRDVRVARDPDASLASRLARSAVSGVTRLLENERGEVATRTTLSGTLADPEAGVWEAILGVLTNAYVEAIRPGFDRAVRGG